MVLDATEFVSVVIPCYNEVNFIGKCIDSILSNGYPLDLFEVLVIDGLSNDGTIEVIKQYESLHPIVRYVENPKRILAAAWNLGIQQAKGDIIMTLNAHGCYQRSYISNCVETLRHWPNADYVGGVINTLPRENTFLHNAVATILSNPFGVGNSYFRIGLTEPMWADTAAFGGYRKTIFKKTGLFNEDLARSQDMEFHLRLKKAGFRILLIPGMICNYYIRSGLKDFIRDSYVNGFWTLYPLRFAKIAISWRHIVPSIFVLALFGSLFLSFFSDMFVPLFYIVFSSYLFVNIYFSIKSSIKKKDSRYFFVLPFLFAILHIGYGVGANYAGLKVIIRKGISVLSKSLKRLKKVVAN